MQEPPPIETFSRVQALLEELIDKSRGKYAVIVDLRGLLLASARAPQAPELPSLDSLAVLISSNYAAMTAIAELFGEERFEEMAQQGEHTGIYILKLGYRTLLVTVFDDPASLGRVKLLAKRKVEEILEVLIAYRDQARDASPSGPAEALLDSVRPL